MKRNYPMAVTLCTRLVEYSPNGDHRESIPLVIDIVAESRSAASVKLKRALDRLVANEPEPTDEEIALAYQAAPTDRRT